jgi:ketosteroid isomerase-like protein
MKLQRTLQLSRAPAAIFAAMNTKNMTVLEPYLSDDVRFDFPGTGELVGKKRVMIFLKALLRKFPDLVFQVRDAISEQDRTCIVWTNTALLETSRPYRNSGVTLVRCCNGRITFISDYFKDTSFVNLRNPDPSQSA